MEVDIQVAQGIEELKNSLDNYKIRSTLTALERLYSKHAVNFDLSSLFVGLANILKGLYEPNTKLAVIQSLKCFGWSNNKEDDELNNPNHLLLEGLLVASQDVDFGTPVLQGKLNRYNLGWPDNSDYFISSLVKFLSGDGDSPIFGLVTFNILGWPTNSAYINRLYQQLCRIKDNLNRNANPVIREVLRDFLKNRPQPENIKDENLPISAGGLSTSSAFFLPPQSLSEASGINDGVFIATMLQRR